MEDALLKMLEQWPEAVHARVIAADRALIDRVPGLKREFDPSNRLVGYMLAPGYKGTLFTILLSRSGVKVGFSHGAILDDPGGLLGGSGKVHRTFTVDVVDDVRNPAFLALVDAAFAEYQDRRQ